MKPEDSCLETYLLSRSDGSNVIDNAVIQELSNHFHFDPHMHNTREVMVCLKGSCTLTCFKNPVTFTKGEYMTVFSNVPHSADVEDPEGCTLLQLHFHPDLFTDMFSDVLERNNLYFLLELSLNRTKFLKGKSFEQLNTCIFFIRQELSQKSTNWEKMVNLYLSQLIILLSRDISHNMVNIPLSKNRHLISAVQYINQHYMNKLMVEEISKECGASPRYINKIFMENLNMNLSTYITYLRINKSIEIMLKKGKDYSLTELALEVGFGSLQHYSKVFKEKMGFTPTKYFGTL